MDRSGDRDPGVPGQRARTQGPWHGAEPAPGPAGRGPWQEDPGPAGQGPWHEGPWQAGGGYPGTWNPGAGEGVFVGDWTAATMAARTLARRVLRFLLLSALAGAAIAAGLIALAVAVWPHGLLAVLLVLLAVPVLLVTAAMAAVVWVGRRAWRSGAWLEAVPVAAGVPWLSRVIWAVRAALVGKAFRRLGRRSRRPAYQARAGDLSGTTR
jgi:hypothetical protein